MAFLKKAKVQLEQGWARMSRRSDPDSHIILLDNVLGPGEEPAFVKGQWVRSEQELEDIFAEAGLIVHARSGRKEMPENYRDIFVWALY